jgi:hypothetical protein
MSWGMRLFAVALAAAAALPAVADAAATDEVETEETRICPGCGEEIPVTAVFCPNCHWYLPDAKVGTKAVRPATDVAVLPSDEPARRRFAGRVKGGVLAGSDMTNAGVWILTGLRATDLVVIGLGFGYQNYPNGNSFPICAVFRANLTRGKIAPIVYAEVGYNKATFDRSFTGGEDPSGPVIGVGGGLDILGATGVGLAFEAGARFESSKEFWKYYYPGGYWGPVMSKEKTFSFGQVAIGVVF